MANIWLYVTDIEICIDYPEYPQSMYGCCKKLQMIFFMNYIWMDKATSQCPPGSGSQLDMFGILGM